MARTGRAPNRWTILPDDDMVCHRARDTSGRSSPEAIDIMNVVVICHVFPPEHAPAGVMVRELAEDLSARGHQVTILTGWPNHPDGVLFPGWQSRFRKTETYPGYTVIRCGHSIHPRQRMLWRLWYYFTFALSTFLNGLILGRADAVLCLSTPLFGSWSAWLLARCKGARFVYDIFDLHPESALNAGLIRDGIACRLFRAMDALLCRASDAIATLSDGLKASICRRGIRPDKIRVIPFWIDSAKITPGDRDNPWRRKHGIAPDTFVALYAGTLGYISGAEVLIDVARELQSRPNILLLVVGTGVVKENMERLAADAGLTNLKFLPFQAQEDLPDVQATADVGLVTLLPNAGLTSIPSKILGYLAAGRAVLASVRETSDTAQMVQAGQCGLVVPCQNPHAIADAIVKLADNPETTAQLGRNGRRLAQAQYARARCTELYEKILSAK